MFDNSITNEKLIENISLKSVDTVPTITYGKVIQNYDEEHPKKVKVQLRTSMGNENNEVWADVLTSYGGNSYGFYTIPEIDSEVVVAFAMNNRNFPIIIGNIWTSKEDLPDETSNKDNYIKRFKTFAGNDICINDTQDKTSISIKTVNGLNLMFDDTNKKVSIYDDDNVNKFDIDFKNKSIILDASDSISLKIGGTEVIKIDAQSVNIETKSVAIRVNNKIELSGGQVSAEGTALNLNSKGNLAIKANGNLSAEATGMTAVKGSILNLN